MPVSHQHTFQKYSDYTPLIPAEQLGEAMRVKQSMYDQGVEKIQGYLNALGEIPLIKDTDREYLQNKVSELTSAIQKNAHLDFSNIDNVNNILAIGKPLEQDEKVYNAKRGTEEYIRRQKTIEELRAKKPELVTAQNMAFFLEDAEEWLNDGQVGSKLGSKEFIPYRDIRKKIIDITSKAKADVTSELQRKGGFFSSTQVQKLTADRIRKMIDAGLDEADHQQLQIDSWYKYKNTPPEELYAQYTNYLNQDIAAKEPIEKYYEAEYNQMLKASKQYPNDPVVKYNLDIAKNNYEQAKQNKQILIDAATAHLATDKLDFKTDKMYNIFYSDFISSAADAYAYEQRKEQWHANPFSINQQEYDFEVQLIGKRKDAGAYDINNSGNNSSGTKPRELSKAELAAKEARQKAAMENYKRELDEIDGGNGSPVEKEQQRQEAYSKYNQQIEQIYGSSSTVKNYQGTEFFNNSNSQETNSGLFGELPPPTDPNDITEQFYNKIENEK